jgi:exodeoxyribonuclease VII large subunit
MLDPTLKAAELNREIDVVITQRKQEYTQNLIELSTHKSVAVRRKIAKSIEKLLPLDYINELKTWQAREGDRETFLALEVLIGRIERGALMEAGLDSRIYTVDEVITVLKKTISGTEYVIEGELGEYKPIPGGVVGYFGLKGSADDALNCMVMRFVVDRLTFVLNPGLKLRITGNFKIGKQARLYFQVTRIELTGEGELLRNFLELQTKLEQEGMFDRARKRTPKPYPSKVLLIASLNSAALTDYLKVIKGRRGGLEIYQLPIKTQGVGAEEEILQALTTAQNLIESNQIDTVVITRGGGASEELFVFNSERIVRAIYALKAPTIVAIGHERDTTLAELVADLRCSTPSQAAELSSVSRVQLLTQASATLDSIKHQIQYKHASYASVAEQLYTVVVHVIEKRISDIVNQSMICITACISLIKQTLQSIEQSSSQYLETIKVLDPKQVLKRGFSLLETKGEVITSVSQIVVNTPYSLLLSDGSVEMRKV